MKTFIDNHTSKYINFNYLMSLIKPHSEYGLEYFKNIKPYSRVGEVQLLKHHDVTEVLIKFHKNNKKGYQKIENCLEQFKNIKNILEKCKCNQVLDVVSIFQIKMQALLMFELINILDEYIDSELSLEIQSIINIDKWTINEILKILDPLNNKIKTFYIYNIYSEKITNIRECKRKIEIQIYELNSTIKFGESSNELEELKTERANYVSLEVIEENKILENISSSLKKYLDRFLENIENIILLDVLMASSMFAIKYNAVRPIISFGKKIIFKNLRHLELENILQSRSLTFTKINIEIVEGSTIITGANMGGKSVAMQAIMQSLVLFHFGFFIPTEFAEIPIIDFVFLVTGDLQNINKGLSTFGSELVRLEMATNLIKNGTGFVAFDEFASSTNPTEATHFMRGILKYMNCKNVFAIIITHLDSVAKFANKHYQIIGLKNIDIETVKQKIKDISIDNTCSIIDIIQKNIDFNLIDATSSFVPKDALNIAMLLGIDNDLKKMILDEYKNI